MKNWRDRKIELLTELYGAAAARFEEEKAEDDRRVFVNSYKMLLEAVRSLPKEPVTLVRVAMNRMIGEECGKLDGIRERIGKSAPHPSASPTPSPQGEGLPKGGFSGHSWPQGEGLKREEPPWDE